MFFQKMADNGHYGTSGKDQSRQGTYVFTAQGKFLSSINNLSADRVLKTLEDGLAKWNALPESEKSPAAASQTELAPAHRWEDSYPRDGLVFTIYNRDLPADRDYNSKQLPTWNRDAAWFSAAEVKEMVPSDLTSGQAFDFPDFFVSRLCRLHFVDSVKGQTEAFRETEIVGSEISGSVTKRDGSILSIKVTGTTRGHCERGRRRPGVETKILGTAVYDEAKGKFLEFEFVALGERWGQTRFNDRRQQLEKTPVGFVFELAAPDAIAINPGMIWEYRGLPWLKLPVK